MEHHFKETVTPEKFLESVSGLPSVIVYDCETTGLDPNENHIIEVAARFLVTDLTGGFTEVDSRKWYINPGYALPEKIVEITGITDEFLADKPSEAEVFAEIADYFGSEAVCGYNNKGFDDRFFSAMYARYGRSFAPERSIDLYQVVPNLVTPDYVKNYKLETLSYHFGFAQEGEVFHDAQYDSLFTEQLLNKCIELSGNSKAEQISSLIRCFVSAVTYWEGDFGNGKLKRVYVDTNYTKFVFNCLTQAWGTKDPKDTIHKYDLENVKAQVYSLTGYKNDAELSCYRGNLRVG